MIRRWISDVPSKIVKILDYGAVFRRSATLPGAVVSARIQHRLFEGRDGFRPGPRTMSSAGPDGLRALATAPADRDSTLPIWCGTKAAPGNLRKCSST